MFQTSPEPFSSPIQSAHTGTRTFTDPYKETKKYKCLKNQPVICDLTFCSSYWHIRATGGPSAARFCDGSCQGRCSTSLLNLYDNDASGKIESNCSNRLKPRRRAALLSSRMIQKWNKVLRTRYRERMCRFFLSRRQRPHVDSLSQK